MKILMQIFLSSSLLFGCTSYNLGDKTFSSMEGALTYQKMMYQEELEKVGSCQYFGGSILVVVPSDTLLTQPPFVTGNLKPELQRYFLTLYKQDFEAVKSAIDKSNMFDSVNVRQVESYLSYATKYGYRYLAVSNGDGSWTIHDLHLGIDKVVRFPKEFSAKIALLEAIIAEFEGQKSSEQFLSGDRPAVESFYFNETTQKGYLSVSQQGIQTRYLMLRKIADFAAAKKPDSEGGKLLPSHLFTVADEHIEDGIFSIEFELPVPRT
ncbi:MAG TPA: hypothetical protein VIS54_04470 [Psychromonas sp.]